MSVIIDSGACSCFIDLTFAANHRIPLQPKAQGLAVHLADGSIHSSGPVTQETVPLLATMGTHHQEILRLDAISSPLFPIILGMPWLQAHNPSINWATGEVKFLSEYCQQHCLQQSSDMTSQLLCLDLDAREKQGRGAPLNMYQIKFIIKKQYPLTCKTEV